MNIIFFLPSINNKGGVERATVSLLNSLVVNTSNKVYLMVFQNDVNKHAFSLNKNIVIIDLGITNYKKQYPKLIRAIRNKIIKYQITHFVTVETMALLFTFLPLMALKKRPKLIVWEHFNFYNDNGRKLRVFFRKLAAKYADLIVTLTQRDVESWNKNLKVKNKITYIYNISPFEGINSEYKIDSKKVISIGRYVEVKGFDRLIKSWRILEEKYDIGDWQLSIVGYGELKEDLQNLVNSLNCKSIQLVDGSTSITKQYEEASFYCMTSYFEGLPMVLIEAQAFGLPSISFDIYSGPSEILGCGSGILIKDFDLLSYAEGIYKLMSSPDLRKELSYKALSNREKFTGREIANVWLNNFRKL